jgi:hypothetical protein
MAGAEVQIAPPSDPDNRQQDDGFGALTLNSRYIELISY